MTRPQVVTGIGITAPNGLDTSQYWAATCAAVPAIGPVTRFDASRYASRLAGEVPRFDATVHLPSRLLPQTDHMTRLALIAADQALRDAAVQPDAGAAYGRGVITASSAGGFEFGQRELEKFFSRGIEFMGAYMSFAWFYAVNTGQISIRHGLKGPGGVLVTDQAGGLDAIAQARRQLRHGSELIVCGGVDSALCPWGWIAQLTSGRVSTSSDPAAAYLPFDLRAAGHVPAEGGALLVLEDQEAARERGAPQVYGEIAGYAATFDPAPGSGREPTLRQAIVAALCDASMGAADIDVVFADAAALPELDQVEAEAIAAVFGERAVPVTIPKTMVGRACAGAAALDVATALLAIRDGVIPPTINVQPSPRYPIEIVIGKPRPAPVGAAVVIARGYGGFNSVVVVRAPRNSSLGHQRSHGVRRLDPGKQQGGIAMPHAKIELQDLQRLLQESAGVAAETDLDGDISDVNFEALGYDSIAIMELAARITRDYGLTIDDEALAEAATLRMLLDLVNDSPQRR